MDQSVIQKSELTLYFCSGEAPCSSYHGQQPGGDMFFELIWLIVPGLPILGGKILAAIDLPSIDELLNITVSKYSQHCSSCWAQCVFLVKLTCQLYLQVPVHWNQCLWHSHLQEHLFVLGNDSNPAWRPLPSGSHCATKNTSDSLEMMAATSGAVDTDEESDGNNYIQRTNPRRPRGIAWTWLIKNTLLIGSEFWTSLSKCLL
jgi:hypothetical protein